MRRIAGICSLLVIGVLGGYSIRFAEKENRPPLSSSVSSPRRIFATGEVEGADSKLALRFELEGVVEQVLVVDSQLVLKDQPLARLKNETQITNLRIAEAGLTEAQAGRQRIVEGASAEERSEARSMVQAKAASLETEQKSLARMTMLRNSISKAEFQAQEGLVERLKYEFAAARSHAAHLDAPPRQSELELNDAKVAEALARVELARIALAQTELRAPCDATVLKVYVDPGESADREDRRPAMMLSNLKTRRIRAFVEELDAPQIREEMKAAVTVDGIGKTFPGVVVFAGLQMSPKQLFSNAPNERLDVATREIVVTLDSLSDEDYRMLPVGLRVDVSLEL